MKFVHNAKVHEIHQRPLDKVKAVYYNEATVETGEPSASAKVGAFMIAHKFIHFNSKFLKVKSFFFPL